MIYIAKNHEKIPSEVSFKSMIYEKTLFMNYELTVTSGSESLN